MSQSPERASPGRALCAVRVPAVLTAALIILGLPLGSAQAADDFFAQDAQTPSPITDYFSLSASYFHASVNTQLRLDPPGIPMGGTSLSGAQTLGFRSSETDGMADLMFRLRDRNRITADYLELDQSGTRTLNSPVVFGNQFFFAGDTLNSALQWRALGLTYTYAFIQNDRFELGAGLGVHLMDLDVRGSVPARFANYETSIAGALPTPALEAIWRITRRFSVTGRAQYLHATLNETYGELGDFHADVQFRVVPNLALGVGYSQLQLKLNSVIQSNPGLAAIRIHGPEAFVRVSF
jgi:hypothetical protein